ncbi:hypothetical protein [Shewanella surugensis]|uniref:Tetratricopeptide repeat protein n=1 Tax=Shewanella surugensis TaxID=212020 RepID=A0ABT0LGV3_9GAMM|nr:hypothetical protein [Shewanella surugensis]MCL1126932.1 hypothetical protein [Shewanella surugensis]
MKTTTFPLTDMIPQLIELSVDVMSNQQQGLFPYKSQAQIKAQLMQDVSLFMEQTQYTFSRSLHLCQTFLRQEQLQRIFSPMYQALLMGKESDPKLPEAKLSDNDYELILSITETLEKSHAFDDAICIYTLLEILKPEDIRAYIGHALSLEAKGDNIKAAQYYNDMTQALNNPMLNFYATQFLLKQGQTFEASERLQSAINALEIVKADSKECADYLIMLQKFKQQHQLN